ncbi:MAG: ChbG/HpnK family deacetylase [Candidatus Eremiobacterota bacterium]
MKQLYINSDDFGLTEGVTRAIVECIRTGAVTSTSAMMCHQESAEMTRRYAGQIPGRIGLHLQLTDGVPCLPPEQVPSLVGQDGRFPRSWRQLGPVEPMEVLAEWEAQFDRCVSLGVQPTHLDSHHNVHRDPRVIKSYCVFARRVGLLCRSGDPVLSTEFKRHRILCPDASYLNWFGGDLSPASLVSVVEATFARLGGSGLVELACHVACVDEDLRQRSTYVEEREEERRVMLDPALKRLLGEAGIALVAPEELMVR